MHETGWLNYAHFLKLPSEALCMNTPSIYKSGQWDAEARITVRQGNTFHRRSVITPAGACAHCAPCRFHCRRAKLRCTTIRMWRVTEECTNKNHALGTVDLSLAGSQLRGGDGCPGSGSSGYSLFWRVCVLVGLVVCCVVVVGGYCHWLWSAGLLLLPNAWSLSVPSSVPSEHRMSL